MLFEEKLENKILECIGGDVVFFLELHERVETMRTGTLAHYIKRLTGRGLLDVEVLRGKTVYKLTEAGKELNDKNKLTRSLHPMNNPVHIQGITYPNVIEARSHFLNRISAYNDGDLLKDEDFDFAKSCLIFTECGRALLNKNVETISLKMNEESPALYITTSTGDFDTIPIIRLLGNKEKSFHRKDVKKAFYNAVDIEPPEGFVVHNGEPFFSDIFKEFFKATDIGYDDIEVRRINNKERVISEDIRAQWVEFHDRLANISFIPVEEILDLI